MTVLRPDLDSRVLCPQCGLPWVLHPIEDGEYTCHEYQVIR